MPKQETPASAGTKELSEMEFEYILKELELVYQSELAARERAEQMGQFFLTALTAISGAVLLVLDSKGGGLTGAIVILLGSLAILVFGVFTFVRICAYREAVTGARIRHFLLRQTLLNYGLQSVTHIYRRIGEPISDGFGLFTVGFLNVMSIFCGLAVSVAAMASIAIVLQLVGLPVFEFQVIYFAIYGPLSCAAFLACFLTLQITIRKFQARSAAQLDAISEPLEDWREYTLMKRD